MNLQLPLQIIVSYACIFPGRIKKEGEKWKRSGLGVDSVTALKSQSVLSIYSSNILQNLASCEMY